MRSCGAKTWPRRLLDQSRGAWRLNVVKSCWISQCRKRNGSPVRTKRGMEAQRRSGSVSMCPADWYTERKRGWVREPSDWAHFSFSFPFFSITTFVTSLEECAVNLCAGSFRRDTVGGNLRNEQWWSNLSSSWFLKSLLSQISLIPFFPSLNSQNSRCQRSVFLCATFLFNQIPAAGT